MDSILNSFFDRINRINRIFSRFSDETVITTSAFRRNLNFSIAKVLDVSAHRLKRENINTDNDHTYSVKRIDYFRFLQKTGNLKYPENPVDPVKINY